MNHYIFEFHGKLHPSAKPEEVAAALARLFQVNPEDTRPLVDGRGSFRREGLNEFTARAYQQHFAKIGALGVVRAMTQTDQPSTIPGLPQTSVKQTDTEAALPDLITDHSPTCPKCQSAEINQTQCLACGVYFEKYYQAQAWVQTATSSEAEMQLHQEIESLAFSGDDEDRAKATKWLFIAGLCLTVLFITDSYLQDVQFLYGAGIDFGYWPSVVGHLPLLRACFLSARVKGYSGLLGLLGLLSLVGLSILFLLPDRRHQGSGFSTRSLITATFCILISVIWFTGLTSKRLAMDQIAHEARLLSGGRHEYPSAELDNAVGLFENEQQEMRDFLERSLAQLQEHNFRPHETSEVADNIFAALGRYAVWRNYQTYLHIISRQPLPVGLKEDQVKEDQRLFAEILEAQINKRSQPRLYEAKTNWMVGDLSNPFWLRVKRHLWNVSDHFQFAYQQAIWQQRRKQTTSEPLERVDISLKNIPLPSLSNTTTTLTDHTITYSAAMGPLSKMPLTLALYREPFKTRLGKEAFMSRVVVISPDFPQKYLYGKFNALQTYSMVYQH